MSCRSATLAPSPAVTTFARLLRIEDTRRDEPAYIDSLLASPDAGSRAAAAMAVGRIAARAHVATLRSLVSDSDSSVAANALFALGMLRDTASATIAERALRASDARAVEAAWLLGELGETARSRIVSSLGDAALTASARAALLLASSRLRPAPGAAIAPWMSNADTAIAWRAVYAATRGRALSAIRAALAQSASSSSGVREQVARAVSKNLAGDSLRATAIAVGRTLTTDADAHVRVNAVRALSTHGVFARDAVLAALRDGDANVRVAAAQSLEPVLDSSLGSWSDALRADTALAFQRSVVEGAVRHGVNLVAITGWRTSRDWLRRSIAAAVDGSDRTGGLNARIARLEQPLSDGDGRVRAAAASALADLADSAAVATTIHQRMIGLLGDPDVGVRTAALGALAQHPQATDLSPAIASYARATSDRDNDARLAFWAFADSALRHVAPDAATEQQVAKLVRPGDPLERLAASHITRFSTWRDSAGTPRPMAWYEERAADALGVTPTLVIETERGILELRLYSADAPLTVFNITALARSGYFDGQRFHRVVPNFVVQGGDPRGDGNGGPGYAIRDEINRRRYLRGTLGMALSGPNTGGSQFFVTHSPQPHLDGGYTVFGQLVRGDDVLDRIVQGDRIVRVTVR